jgi:hypothetical protein
VERPTRGAFGPVGGERVNCMRDIFILNETWAQGKIYILISTLLVKIFYLSLITHSGSKL